MLNLNSTIELNLRAFLRWWLREVGLLVPEKIKRLICETQGFLIISAYPDQLQLSYQSNGQTEYLFTIDRHSSILANYQELLDSDKRFTKAKVVLRLTGQDALVRELALPAAAKENLRQVITYELDRYTPFKAEQVYFAVKYLPKKNIDHEQIHILLVLTTRTLFNDLCHDVKALGFAPLLADCENEPNDYEQDSDIYNLLPDWLSPKIARTPQLIHSALLGLLLLLVATVAVLPIWFDYSTIQILEKKIQDAEKEAKEINEKQSEIDAITKQTQYLLNEKNTAPSMLALLNTLSSLMKDDTWLVYLHYDADGRLKIQGESATASNLIEVLENSDAFSHPEFVSPVIQDSSSKLENFEITVEPVKKITPNDQ